MRITIGLLGALLALGCSSPEAARSRGGGPGGDMGNRGETVQMHGGSEPYYKTPQLIGSGAEPADRQADRR